MGLNMKDKKILHELDKNARITNSEIAKKVGLSKDAVGYRIKQSENKKIIRGYRTLVNVRNLGYSFYRVYFRFIDLPEPKLKEIIGFLKKEKNTWWIGRLDGSWDFAFAYWTKEEKDFHNFYMEFSKKFRKYVKDKLISPIISYQEFPKKYLIDSKKIPLPMVEELSEVKLDKIDLEIISSLSKNARKPLIEIAHKLKVDPKTIINRLRKLENQKTILGYKVDLDVSKLNRDFYTVEIDLNNFSKFKELEEEIFSLKEFTARAISIGGYDLEFDLEIENTQRYYEIIDRLKSKFPEIREVRYFRVIENHKLLHMPEI